jgi:SAM-dependent methyltransferase
VKLGAETVAADLDDAALKDVWAWLVAMLDEGEIPSLSGCGCVTADALQLPFPDGSFDRIIVSEVLEHVPQDERAMAEIARVLRPGGTVAVTVPRWWPEVILWALSREYHSNAGGHVRIFRRRQLLGRLRKAGLTPEQSHHAHAFHSVYWWLKCLVGVRRDEAFIPRSYHRFLVWEMADAPDWVRALERFLNPFMGKSLVVYLEKEALDAR